MPRSKDRKRRFLFHVELKRKDSTEPEQQLAEVSSSCEENARRRIIHTVMSEGGHVVRIHNTDDPVRLPDERKRVYMD